MSTWGAGVEKGADAVVLEAAEPERGALHALDEVVDRFRWPVRDVRLMPRDDLCRPLADRAVQARRASKGVDSSVKSRPISATHAAASSTSVWS